VQRLESRTQLVNFICENIAQNAIVRACHNGTVKVLGGFSIIPPGTAPGWIVAITSVHGRTWMVAVTSDDHRHIFHAWIANRIPWKYYVGRADRGEYSIYDGDNPVRTCLAKEKDNG